MNYTAENICKWALENREMLIRWLRPHGGKSLLLNNELKKGPALLIFIPYNPLAEIHPLLDEVSEMLWVLVFGFVFFSWGGFFFFIT